MSKNILFLDDHLVAHKRHLLEYFIDVLHQHCSLTEVSTVTQFSQKLQQKDSSWHGFIIDIMLYNESGVENLQSLGRDDLRLGDKGIRGTTLGLEVLAIMTGTDKNPEKEPNRYEYRFTTLPMLLFTNDTTQAVNNKYRKSYKATLAHDSVTVLEKGDLQSEQKLQDWVTGTVNLNNSASFDDA